MSEDREKTDAEYGTDSGSGECSSSDTSGIPNEQRVRLLGDLTSGLSHDLNNIFAIVLSNVRFIRRELPDDHTVQEDLRDIEVVSNRGVALADRLRSIGGNQILNPQPVDLVELLSSMCAATEGVFSNVALEIGPRVPLVNFDRAKLELVVEDLVAGANKLMGCKSVLHMEVRRSAKSGDEGGSVNSEDGAELLIRDIGSGIPPDLLCKVFEPYFTVERTRVTSLELASAQGLVCQSGGSLEVLYEESKAAFRMWLPAAEGDTSLS